MRKPTFIILACILLSVSCKKESNSSPIVGTWIEVPPCVVYDCYTFVFSNNSQYTQTEQGTTDTNSYNLLSGNRIVFYTQYFGIDTYNYQLFGDTMLILDSFYSPPGGGIYVSPKYNVTLRKTK